MNNIRIVYGLFFCIILFYSCNDNFLDKEPITGGTEDNSFTSYDNFKYFAYPLYEMFTDKNIPTSIGVTGQDGQYQGDIDAGYFEQKYTSGYNRFAYQTVSSVSTGNGWDFSYIRRVNILLSHIQESSLSEAQKNHWKAVAYFFHSFWYIELINKFGDVPWVNSVLNDTTGGNYGPRIDRKIVADSVLNRLKWAENNIGDFTSFDGNNTINRDCVLALISRFGLREGTWRKYHGISGYEKFLQECILASEKLMSEYPTLYKGTDGQPAAGYGEMWTSDDLSKVPGIILYKQFVKDINPHNSSYIEHTASQYTEMNHDIVNLYLMKNGKPIGNPSSGYCGQETMYQEFRNRDPRLYHVVMPPYKVKAGKGTYSSWSFTTDSADREYIDIMGPNESCSNPGEGMKRLPAQNWTAQLVDEIPRVATVSFVTCRSGYYVWKNWDAWEINSNNESLNVSDKPIFKIEEILLNEAEAKYELGEFNQNVADATINKFRDRAGVARMKISEVDNNFDPNRPRWYPKGNEEGVLVEPLLWEIRRERIVELMGEGFGFSDIRRWRMAPYFLNRAIVGIWMTKDDALKLGMTLYNPLTGFSDGKDGSLKAGNLYLFDNPIKDGKGWLEKYYLYQVPTTELLLNPALKQNPGW